MSDAENFLAAWAFSFSSVARTSWTYCILRSASRPSSSLSSSLCNLPFGLVAEHADDIEPIFSGVEIERAFSGRRMRHSHPRRRGSVLTMVERKFTKLARVIGTRDDPVPRPAREIFRCRSAFSSNTDGTLEPRCWSATQGPSGASSLGAAHVRS